MLATSGQPSKQAGATGSTGSKKDASYSQGGSTYNPATNTLDTDTEKKKTYWVGGKKVSESEYKKSLGWSGKVEESGGGKESATTYYHDGRKLASVSGESGTYYGRGEHNEWDYVPKNIPGA